MGRFKSFFGSSRLSKYSDYIFVIVVVLGLIYEISGCITENSRKPTDAFEQKIEQPETGELNF